MTLFFFLFTPVSVAALPLPKKLTHRCPVCTKVLAWLGHKQCVCLHSTRPLAFYGAVIQAWPGNSCGTPSLSLSPPEHWTLANVISLLMLCSTAVKPAYPCAQWHARFTGVQSVVMWWDCKAYHRGACYIPL